MQLGAGASMTLGPGASMTMGNVHIPGGQTISGDSPARMSGPVQQTVVIWVSFTFDTNGERVITFLESAIGGVETIVNELVAL